MTQSQKTVSCKSPVLAWNWRRRGTKRLPCFVLTQWIPSPRVLAVTVPHAFSIPSPLGRNGAKLCGWHPLWSQVALRHALPGARQAAYHHLSNHTLPGTRHHLHVSDTYCRVIPYPDHPRAFYLLCYLRFFRDLQKYGESFKSRPDRHYTESSRDWRERSKRDSITPSFREFVP